MSPIRTILAEPQHLFMQGEVSALAATDDIEIVDTVDTGEAALNSIHAHIPDVAVLAMSLPDISGLEVLEALRGEPIPILFLTGEAAKETVFEAIMLGARGYLLKRFADIKLRDAVRRVHNGDIVLDSASLKLFLQAVRERVVLSPGGRVVGKATLLSKRETEVLTLIGHGHNQNRIARMLQLSPTTVRTHLRNAYIKLGVKTQAAAISEAMRRGLIDGNAPPATPRTFQPSQHVQAPTP